MKAYSGVMVKKGAVPLSDDIERCLSSLGLPEVSLLVSLGKAWLSVAGDLVAKKAVPAGFRNGVLTIAVCNHSWAQELQMNKPALLSKIIAAVPRCPVSNLRFVVGAVPAPEKDPAPPHETAPACLAPEPEALLQISDPEIRESLRAIIRGMQNPG